MRSNKKGDFNDVKGIILALIIVLVLGLVWVVFSKVIAKGYDKEGCRNSVLQNSFRIEVGGTEIIQPFGDINCPTVTEKVDRVENNRVFRVLANNLYDCWDKFGQGRIKFLDPKTKNYCIICSRIEFEGEARGREIPGFLEFLATKKIADEKGLQYSDLTYLEFLTPYQTKEGLLDKFKNVDQDKINTNNYYATLFLMYKRKNEGKLEIYLKGSAIGCLLASAGGVVSILAAPVTLGGSLATVGLFTGAATIACGSAVGLSAGAGYLLGSDHSSEWGARTVLVPYQDISKLGCDSLQ